MTGFWKFVSAMAVATAAMFSESAAQTIRMWTFLDPDGTTGREVVLKQLIEEFEAQNSSVTIQVEPQVWQQMSDKFLAAHQTGTAPDVIWLHHGRVIEAIRLGALANLDRLFVKDWSAEEIADIAGPFWRYGAEENAHYHIVHSRAVNGQFYRVDLFREAKIDPASLTTWDKLIEAARKLTLKDANGNVTRWGFGQFYPTEGASSPIMLNVLIDEQKDIFDADGRAKWATPAGLKGLNLELDMIRKHGITPETAINMKEDDVYDLFHAGRAAMVRGAITRVPRAQAALGAQNVGYLRTPSFTEGEYSPGEVTGWAVGVWSNSPNLELAGKWLEYMSSPEADEMWVTQAGVVPIRQSTIKDNPDFFAKPENAYLATAAEEMQEGWLLPAGVSGGFNDEMNRAAQDVFINGATPEDALRKAEETYNRRQR